MDKLKKLLASLVVVAVGCCAFVLCACSRGSRSDYDYVACSQTENVLYAPEEGAYDIMPYYEDGIYYIYYTSTQKGRPVHLVETGDFVEYKDRGRVLAPVAISGESELGGGSVTRGEDGYYLFYTGSNGGKRQTVRVAISEDSVTFKRKQDFILHAESYGFKEFFDADVHYDETINRFVAIVSTTDNGYAALAMFYFNSSLTTDGVEYVGIIHKDGNGHSISAPTMFEIDGDWYVTYTLKDDTGAECVKYLSGKDKEGPFAPAASLDGGSFFGAKAVAGKNNMLIGKVGDEFVAHTVTKNANGLALSYPVDFSDKFGLPVPVSKESVELSSQAESIAVGIDSYRLSAELKVTAASELKFTVGDKTVTVNRTFGKMSVSGGGGTAYLNLLSNTEYHIDLVVYKSVSTLYIDGVALSFCGGANSVEVWANGAASLTDIKAYSPENSAIFNGQLILNAGESKTLKLKASRASYALGKANLYSEENITVELKAGKEKKSVSGSGFVSLYNVVPASKGDDISLKITSSASAAVYGDMLLRETYLSSLPKIRERDTINRGAEIEVDKDGYIDYDAKIIQTEAEPGIIKVEKDGVVIAQSRLADGYGSVKGSVYALKGSVIKTVVDCSAVVPQYNVKLTLNEGVSTNNALPKLAALGKGYDNGVALPSTRPTSISSTEAFGAQGEQSFIYVYGKATDELTPFESLSSGTYTTASTDKVSQTAGNITVGGGYYSGAVFVAAKSGRLLIELTVTPQSKINAILSVNGAKLFEKTTQEEEEFSRMLYVSEGDEVSFLMAASGDSATAAYNLTATAKKEPQHVKIADYVEDFYSDILEANNWLYGYVSNYDYGTDTFTFTRITSYNSGAWNYDDMEIKSDWMRTESNNGREVTVGYKVEQTAAYRISIDFEGEKADETRIEARVLVASETGGTAKSAVFIGDGSSSHMWNKQITVEASEGDVIYVAYFRKPSSGYAKGHFNIEVERYDA